MKLEFLFPINTKLQYTLVYFSTNAVGCDTYVFNCICVHPPRRCWCYEGLMQSPAINRGWTDRPTETASLHPPTQPDLTHPTGAAGGAWMLIAVPLRKKARLHLAIRCVIPGGCGMWRARCAHAPGQIQRQTCTSRPPDTPALPPEQTSKKVTSE